MMEEFLKDINKSIFKRWVLLKSFNGVKTSINEDYDYIINLDTKYCHGEIAFYDNDIVDLSVYNKITNEGEFYLHFQFHDMKHALELYTEFVTCVKSLRQKPKKKVMLCCSAGMTTGFFAEKLQEASDLMNLNYEVSAHGYARIFQEGQDADIILLAPQVKYYYAEMKKIFDDKLVIKIPNQVFGRYDVAKMIEIIKEELNNIEIKKIHGYEIIEHDIPEHDGKILIIALFRNRARMHIAARVYDEKNYMLYNNETLKLELKQKDLYDIIDTLQYEFGDIRYVGISTPGIINEKTLNVYMTTNINDIHNINYSLLSQRYRDIKFKISNDVNTAAVGYLASQEKYNSISFIFQPVGGHAGIGSIYERKLILGKGNVAGEIQYVSKHSLSKPYLELSSTPEGTLELLDMMGHGLVSLLGPEAIIISASLLTDANKLIDLLKVDIPEEYIPDIILVDNFQEYTIIGQLLLTILEFQESR